MRCRQFEERLQHLLDRRQAPSEDAHLMRHARRCPECRETLAACARMLDGLNLLELPVPDDDFSQRVVNRTPVRRPPFAGRRVGNALAAVAAALAMSLLLSVAWRTDRTESPPAAAPLIAAAAPLPENRQATDAAANRTNPTPQHGPSLSTSLALAQQQPLSLLLRWKETWGEAAWRPVDDLADGLNPITVPLSVAVEEIRRAIPLGLADEPPAPSADSVRRNSPTDEPPVV